MAATVTSQVLLNDTDTYTIHLTGLFNDAAETNVVKVDKSTLVTEYGTEPSTLKLLTARWAVQGYTYVKVSWDETTDVTAVLLSGNGYEDYTAVGGLFDSGSGGAGDVLLSTVGGAATATYDITLTFAKVA